MEDTRLVRPSFSHQKMEVGPAAWHDTRGKNHGCGRRTEPLLTTVRTPEAGKPAERDAAVEVALLDFLDDRPEEALFLLETSLILGQEPVEIMKKHPVEDGPLRISRTIDSRHGGRMASRNGSKSRIRPRLSGKA